uniref:DUF38 domain-containing protein n=1 Tax=Panagrolaimus davidi TaxID=227884 RepID=A0A914PD14_9BILA
MLKLDEDFFDEICDEIIKNDNKEHKSLLNFMLSGKKPLDSAIRWFSTLEIQDVQVSGNIWILNKNIQIFFDDDRFSFERKKDWVFDNFPFIKYISLAIVENVKVVTLRDATPKCFAFLQQLTSLKRLVIKVSSVEKFKELLPALKSLTSVEELNLSVPHGTVKLFDLLNFNIKRITCNLFDMEKTPVCKVRNDIKSFELLEERNPKKNFIFEPQHFRNYKKLLPNSGVRFFVNHTVTDKDLPEVYKFFKRQKKNIAVEVEMVVNITYYNLAPITESKMYKELRRLAFNPGVIYEPFILKENYYGVFMFYQYDFPQRLEVAKNKWNRR